MPRNKGDVLLVGSLPFETAEEAMRQAGSMLGDHLSGIPDGEVGLRKTWIAFLPLTIYSKNPAIEVARAPDGVPSQPTEKPGMWTANFDMRIKPGSELHFDKLGYADEALKSYEDYVRLKEGGAIADGVRFQVTFPSTGSAVTYFFGDQNDWPAAHAAYHDVVGREIERILEIVPAESLQIQFDFANEFIDLAAGDRQVVTHWPAVPYEEKIQRWAKQIPELTRSVPEKVTLGIHWCYGTWGGWPMGDLQDLGTCVRMSNEAISRSARKIDYIHMPVVPRPDDAFLAPLKDLSEDHPYIYLGLIHHTEGSDSFEQSVKLAHKFLPEFGVGAVCGYGRLDPSELAPALQAHREAAALLEKV